MKTAEIRNEIKKYIDTAEDRLLKAVYAMLKEYSENAEVEYKLNEDDIAMLEERRKEYKSGKNKTYSVKEIKKMIVSKNGK